MAFKRGFVVSAIYPSTSNFWPFDPSSLGERQAVECYELNVLLAERGEVATDSVILYRINSDNGQAIIMKRWTRATGSKDSGDIVVSD